MHLLPIHRTLEENENFAQHPDCQETLPMSLAYYEVIGFQPPWIGYYASENGQIVGSCAYKGAPVEGKVEIAYGTFPAHQQKGVATEMCRLLVELALRTDPDVAVTARTLPEPNFSTRVLQKNGFVLLGTVQDPEDGEVWEWGYQK